MEKYAVFVDIDGTLLNTKHMISEESKETIRLLKENGHKVFICTGRPLCDLDDYILEPGFDGIVAAGGAYVEAYGHIYRNIQFNSEKVQKVEKVLNELEAGISYERLDGVYVTRLFKKYVDENIEVFTKSYADKMIVVDEGFMETGKFTFICKKDKLEIIKERLDNEFEVIKAPYMDHTKDYVFGEICLKGITKDDGIKSLNLNQKIIAIGDSDNDIGMLKYADIGIAMGNASDNLKAVADMISEHVDDEGFMKAFKKLQLI